MSAAKDVGIDLGMVFAKGASSTAFLCERSSGEQKMFSGVLGFRFLTAWFIFRSRGKCGALEHVLSGVGPLLGS